MRLQAVARLCGNIRKREQSSMEKADEESHTLRELFAFVPKGCKFAPRSAELMQYVRKCENKRNAKTNDVPVPVHTKHTGKTRPTTLGSRDLLNLFKHDVWPEAPQVKSRIRAPRTIKINCRAEGVDAIPIKME